MLDSCTNMALYRIFQMDHTFITFETVFECSILMCSIGPIEAER